jgi:hypothetical protein
MMKLTGMAISSSPIATGMFGSGGSKQINDTKRKPGDIRPIPSACRTGLHDEHHRGEEKKMNKQMTPAEIELVQQRFARLAPISDKAVLAEVQSGPWPPPPNIPAAIAPAGMTMK